ncbi:D-aminoacyl-tRNA deacylase [Dermabacter hominis]|uniref:D-aminoacyl-tRNA deacylase n=1 Tax=Dermabacter hominis TaxID=36740 RepID=UPI0021B01ABC|nr:D-aminoacyl-tRNA deacylase [Dermabacter hominis]MCT2024622.1 D-aminoacyl-tRNA deacylase [Dermabacter hominis]
MRAIVQKVNGAKVEVLDAADGPRRTTGEFEGEGLVVLLGITHDDGESAVETMARKICELRILNDEKSALDKNAPVMIISQFTLYADVRKGRRPSWNKAAPGPVAEPLVQQVINRVRERGLTVHEGEFGAHMQVSITNDGPMTILIETE